MMKMKNIIGNYVYVFFLFILVFEEGNVRILKEKMYY